jgi:hypothetical protein
MYDAWAAYDRVAVGTRFAGALRQPPGKRTLRNKRAAISFAAYRAAAYLFPASTPRVFDPLMAQPPGTTSGSSDTFTTTFTTQLRVRGSDGSFVTFREVAHLTVTASGLKVALDRPTMLCS